jgi:hypothetical protein
MGNIWSDRKILSNAGLEKKSPRTKKCNGRGNKTAKIQGSKKADGWFAARITGLSLGMT